MAVIVAALALFGLSATSITLATRPSPVDTSSTSSMPDSICAGLRFPDPDLPSFGRANLDSPLPEEAFDSKAVRKPLVAALNNEMDLYRLNASIFIPADSLEFLDQIVEIGAARTLNQGSSDLVLVLDFTICGQERKAYALVQETGSASAVLMIPGTGENQSSQVYLGSEENYHCCLYPMLRHYDAYIQILPNQDHRAWHNGRGLKISWNYILRWQINNGGSYSASYIAETIALKKYLSSRNDAVALVGLSQGANAALIAGSISPPDALVVSSGYSVGQLATEFADEMQITLPGISLLLDPENIATKLEFPTQFSFGLMETGVYGWEATSQETCKFFAGNPQIECVIHREGHTFPEASVIEFLDRALPQRAPLR